MASVYVIEIDGWGEVGPAINVTTAQGFADGTFTLTTGGTPPPATEYGAMIWVEGVSAVVANGFYTLTARTGSTFTMQALPAGVTVTTAGGLSGLARIEDHYRIADGLPSWVTGANAIARWHLDLVSVTQTAGQRLDPIGGVASVDGFELLAASTGRGLLATSPATYRFAAVGSVTIAEAFTATATEIVTYSAAPYSGESATTPGTAAAQPPLFGIEAIDIRGTASPSPSDGVTEYTITHDGSSDFVTRGVLRTLATGHTESEFVYGALPTPIGQVVRSFVYDHGHASHAARSEVSTGVCESVFDEDLGNVVRLAVASSIIDPNRKTLNRSYGVINIGATDSDGVDYDDTYTWTVEAAQYNDSQWGWCRDGLAAQRITWTGELVDIDTNGTRVYRYDVPRWPLVNSEDYPMIRPASSLPEFAAYSSSLGRSLRLRGTASERAGAGRFTLRKRHELCHVFEPVTWAYALSPPGEFPGVVTVNPVDVVLTVLMSTGTPTTNGAHDLAPEDFGMGIPASRIDMDTFTAIGDALYSGFVAAATVFIDQETKGTLEEWLDGLLKAFCLGLVTDTSGKLRLVDMAQTQYTTTQTLTESDLVGPIGVRYGVSPGTSLSSIVLKFMTPFVMPVAVESHIVTESAPGSAFGDGFVDEDGKIVPMEVVFNQMEGGISKLLRRIGSGRISTVTTEFAPFQNYSQRSALRQRFTRLISQNMGIGARFPVDVDPGYVGQIGDIVAATLPNLPNVVNSGSMDGVYCRIEDRIHEFRPIGDNPRDTLVLRVFGTAAAVRLAWSPGAEVSSVTSPTSFNVVAAEFHGADDTSDATTFPDGAKVHVFDANFQLRSTSSAGTVDTTSGNAVTLSAAAQGGSGPITPNAGDLILFAPVGVQVASIGAPFASISSTTPGTRWN